MRNEQKHGLDEDEVVAYNKLVELLGHMWGFITIQSEMQLKIQKERKKSEKVVYDSEERAFWRNRVPGQPNCLEPHIRTLARHIRKQNIQGHRQQVERLKLSLKTKPWLKAMKASETQVTWCEQFQDYDPFITPSQPPNPWITDDVSLWTLNTDAVEVPTERRVKRWSLSVQELVNVDSRTLEETLKHLRDPNVARRHAFWNAEEHVFTLMSKDSYPRFIRSQIYKGVLSAAQQQGSRRLGWRKFISAARGGTHGGAKSKMSRDERDATHHQFIPKQLSSDSLPLKALPQGALNKEAANRNK
ncbi:Regulator of G-protein signaling 7 [Aphelenchoides fujianensis]|nr:Regulator of G-protein signaling 7 [Aphelenchoides fujianensis]